MAAGGVAQPSDIMSPQLEDRADHTTQPNINDFASALPPSNVALNEKSRLSPFIGFSLPRLGVIASALMTNPTCAKLEPTPTNIAVAMTNRSPGREGWATDQQKRETLCIETSPGRLSKPMRIP